MRAAALALAGCLCAASVHAQDRIEPVPKALARVGVEEKPDAALPLSAVFTDDRGRTVTLGSYFAPGRPVVLTLNYYRCPMLCTLELNGLVDAMKGLSWSPGGEYETVTVSFDPRENATLARAKKQSYLVSLGKPEAEAGWHFLTGPADSIDALTRAVGFTADYDRATDQYGHAAVILVATPDGRVSRYLYGVKFDPGTLKLALVEASQGKIGTSWDRFLLYCYHYDPDRGRYSLAALTIVRAGGMLTVLALAFVIGGFWLRERAGRRG